MSDRKPDYHAINREGHLVTIPGSEPLTSGFTLVPPEHLDNVKAFMDARASGAIHEDDHDAELGDLRSHLERLAEHPPLDQQPQALEHAPSDHAPEGDHKAS